MESNDDFATEVSPGALFALPTSQSTQRQLSGESLHDSGRKGAHSENENGSATYFDTHEPPASQNLLVTIDAAQTYTSFVDSETQGAQSSGRIAIVDDVDREADALGVSSLCGTAAAPAADDDEFDWDRPAAATPAKLLDARRSGAPALAPSSAQQQRQQLLPVPPAAPPVHGSTSSRTQPRSNASAPSIQPHVPPQPPPTAGGQQLLSTESTAGALLAVRQQFVVHSDQTGTSSTANGSAEAGRTVAANVEAQVTPSYPSQPLGPLTEIGEGDEDESSEEDEDDELNPRVEHTTGDAVAAATPVEPIIAPANPAAAMPSIGSEPEVSLLEQEFEDANAARQQEQVNGHSGSHNSAVASVAQVPAAELCDLILADPALSAHRSSIVTGIDAGKRSVLSCFSSLWNPKLLTELAPQRDAIFCLAKHSYQSDNPPHVALMSSLYAALTGGRSSASPSASWQDIGFQRDGDFTTDLRGAGMLGPLQVYCMVHLYPWLAHGMYSCSRDPMAPFPFMVQCINMTAKTLQLCRTNKMTRLMNQRRQAGASSPSVWPAWTVFMDVYCGLVLSFMDEWAGGAAGSTSPPSISRIGHIMQGVVDKANKDVAGMVAALLKRDSEVQRGGSAGFR